VLNHGMALATIFEYDSSIFRCKRMQDVAARLLRTGTDEPWNALITPPACGMSGLCSPTDALVHSRPRFGMLAHLPLSVDPPHESRGSGTSTRQSRMRIHRFASAGKYRSGSARPNCTIVGSSFCPRFPPIARDTAAQLYSATTRRACTATATKH
jgi:hypothetical protein